MFLSEHPDFKDLIGQVAGRMGVRNAIVEKDYWVTLALYHLAHSEFKDEFIFKGGTSLSKAFKLIKRFSEDVDLLFIDIGKKKRTRLEKIRDFISSQGFAYYEGDDTKIQVATKAARLALITKKITLTHWASYYHLLN